MIEIDMIMIFKWTVFEIFYEFLNGNGNGSEEIKFPKFQYLLNRSPPQDMKPIFPINFDEKPYYKNKNSIMNLIKFQKKRIAARVCTKSYYVKKCNTCSPSKRIVIKLSQHSTSNYIKSILTHYLENWIEKIKRKVSKTLCTVPPSWL